MLKGTGDALEWALALAKAPAERTALRQRALPSGMERLLQVAAGATNDTLTDLAAQTGESAAEIVEAARFYAREVLFHQGADAYRVLGVANDADTATIRTHHRLLQQWLHPDRHTSDWDAIFAARVNAAWHRLRSDQRRQAYDRENPPQRRDQMPANVVSPSWLNAQPGESGEEHLGNWGRRAPVLALFAVCGVLAILAMRDMQRDPVSLSEIATLERDAAEGGTDPQTDGAVELRIPEPATNRTVAPRNELKSATQPVAVVAATKAAPRPVAAAVKSASKPVMVAMPAKPLPQPIVGAAALQRAPKAMQVLASAKPVPRPIGVASPVKPPTQVLPVAAPAKPMLQSIVVAAPAKPVPRPATVTTTVKPAPKPVAVVVTAKPASKPLAVPVKPAPQPVAVAPKLVPKPAMAVVPAKPDPQPARVANSAKPVPKAVVVPAVPITATKALVVAGPAKTAPKVAAASKPAAMIPSVKPEPMPSAAERAADVEIPALPTTVAASSSSSVEVPGITIQRTRQAQQVGGQLMTYMAKSGSAVPPIWGSLSTQRGAAQLRGDLHGNGTVKLDPPYWRVGDNSASMQAKIRYQDGRIGRLSADFVWREQRWLVNGLSVERDL